MVSKAACQLLTAIDDGAEAAARVLDPGYAVQQKFDGKRILLHIESDLVTAYNRDGLECGISREILTEARRFSMFAPLMFDAEWIREIKSLYTFDLLELEGADLRREKFVDRIGHLRRVFQGEDTFFIHQARTEVEEKGKVALVRQIWDLNLEGITLKRLDAPYVLARAKNQYKHKRTHDSSFLVIRRNQKASVDLALFDDNDRLIEVGSVKIRNASFDGIKEGTILEVRYMYAFPSHQIYQPRMLRVRDDLQLKSCLLSQLKYKAVNPIAV
jgi:bifunctional non-homologous end joining protein LigD